MIINEVQEFGEEARRFIIPTLNTQTRKSDEQCVLLWWLGYHFGVFRLKSSSEKWAVMAGIF